MDHVLPIRLQGMLQQTLQHVADQRERAELSIAAQAVAEVAWTKWLSARTPADNRLEHEFVVFENILRIAEGEQLSLSEKRIAAGFAFLHDTGFIHRVTESEIRAAATPAEQARLESLKSRQRLQHMELGAANTREVLEQLNEPQSGKLIFTTEETARCVSLVAKHDLWKLNQPWPMSADRLALCCVEGDSLWPLHPLGVMADLERPNDAGETLDHGDPAAWQRQLQQSLLTLIEYRRNWAQEPGEVFLGDAIFRTPTGYKLYSGWLAFWKL